MNFEIYIHFYTIVYFITISFYHFVYHYQKHLEVIQNFFTALLEEELIKNSIFSLIKREFLYLLHMFSFHLLYLFLIQMSLFNPKINNNIIFQKIFMTIFIMYFLTLFVHLISVLIKLIFVNKKFIKRYISEKLG